MRNFCDWLEGKVNALLLFIFGYRLFNLRLAFTPHSGWRSFHKRVYDMYLKTWAFRGCLGLLAALGFYLVFGNKYPYDSMLEGIAPKFWNTVVMLGLLYALLGALVGIAFTKLPENLAPSWLLQLSLWLKQSAKKLIQFASEVGALGLGILAGLLVAAIVSSEFTVGGVIRAVGGVFLLSVVLGLNVLVWYVNCAALDDAERPEVFVYWMGRSDGFKATASAAGLVLFVLIMICVDGK